MRIAVDTLGGDNAPEAIVSGATTAARRLPGDEFLLVGDPEVIRDALGEDPPMNVTTRESRQVIGMAEDPAAALRARPESSIAVCADLVRGGDAEALFSAGNTGATVAAALLKIGRLKNCRRPAIAAVMPFEKPVLLLDVGATVQCRAQDLLNFAILGSVFARRYLGVGEESGSRVGLINVGEEPGKGSDLAKEAYKLLEEHERVRFVGNVEGRDVTSGAADVLVTDGFTGNVILKTAEGVSEELFRMIRSSISSSGTAAKLAGAALRPKLRGIRDQVDPENYGGVFLLGVRGSVMIGHGNSGARGVENALVGISQAGGGLSDDLESALAAPGGEPAEKDPA